MTCMCQPQTGFSKCTKSWRTTSSKTQVWNRAGIAPDGIDVLTARARIDNPEAVVWKGDPFLPVDLQELKVLGVPIGQPEYVQAFLVRKSEAQRNASCFKGSRGSRMLRLHGSCC